MTWPILDFVQFQEKCPKSKEMCMRIPYGKSRLGKGNLITTYPVHLLTSQNNSKCLYLCSVLATCITVTTAKYGQIN